MSSADHEASWLPAVLPEPYRDMMRQFYVHSGDEIVRHRLPPFSAQGWELRRQQVRRQLEVSLGGFPERTPLNARITGVHQRRGYRIENVVFESRPGFHVTASVFVPDGLIAPAPAVLCPHGHWAKGRYQDVVQRRCAGLASRGYVTLAIDAAGYNDREPQGHRRSWYLFSTGQTLQGILVWDNMRAIDYLCTREDVDPERIGCTGCSGGGNQTMYVSALDERIKASVPVCSVEPVMDYMEKAFCTCEAVPGILADTDLTEVCGLIAPRALLLIHGMLDRGFPIVSARMAAARIGDIYRLHDPERFAAFESYAAHDYNAEMRQAMYDWFDRWLMGRATEGYEEAPGEEALRVLPEGLPPEHATLASVFVSRLEGMPIVPEPADAESWHDCRAGLAEGLRMVLGGLPLRGDLDVRAMGSEERDGYRLERFWFRSEPDVVIPAVLLVPTTDGPHDVSLYLLAGGKASLAEEEALAQVRAGRAVLAFDQRGVGETAYDPMLLFTSSLALGRPLLGQHAWDAMRCIDYLGQRGDVARVHLIAGGSLAASMTGLLVAALDRRVASARLEALPATLRIPFEDPGTDALYLPNLLCLADLPDLAAMVAPRPLRVDRLLGEGLAPLDGDAARRLWRPAAHVYRLLAADAALTLPA